MNKGQELHLSLHISWHLVYPSTEAASLRLEQVLLCPQSGGSWGLWSTGNLPEIAQCLDGALPLPQILLGPAVLKRRREVRTTCIFQDLGEASNNVFTLYLCKICVSEILSKPRFDFRNRSLVHGLPHPKTAARVQMVHLPPEQVVRRKLGDEPGFQRGKMDMVVALLQIVSGGARPFLVVE